MKVDVLIALHPLVKCMMSGMQFETCFSWLVGSHKRPTPPLSVGTLSSTSPKESAEAVNRQSLLEDRLTMGETTSAKYVYLHL